MRDREKKERSVNHAYTPVFKSCIQFEARVQRVVFP